jgi:hypothetical protein
MKMAKLKTTKHKLFSPRIVNTNFATNKCNKQRQKTYERSSLIVCGDIELNPGHDSTSISVLTARLARIGRKAVHIVGDGNCFFRSVSHQLYQTETYHAQIRALAIQHLINGPEHFIESNTDQSWMQYLQDMSRLGTWADHIIIQAVANSYNLIIHITESASNFSERMVASSIYANVPGGNARDIYIGHLDEMHYISTTPISRTVSVHCESNAKPDNMLSNKSANSSSRKEYMRQYMKKKRMNNEFKTKENEREKIYNRKYKHSNPAEKVKESQKRADAAYKQSNPEKRKVTLRKADVLYRQSNPETVKASGQKSSATYRQLHPEIVKTSSKISTIAYRQNHPENYKVSQKKQYLKRNLATSENETDLGLNKHKRCKCNPESQISMSEGIALFHKNIHIGPEYICTCCEQLWYNSSVTKCNPDLYKSCSKEILNLCVTTGIKSIDDTEWICSTCHSNLKPGKLPSCAKANKMTFPVKPDVLKNLTRLEERLISPRIPFSKYKNCLVEVN